MRNILQLILVLLVGSTALGEMGITVYLSEPNLVLEPISVTETLVEYPEVMVGTKLAIVLDSNEGGRWHGGLFIEGDSRGYGVLSGRDYNDLTLDWEGSHYPEAGSFSALVSDGSDIKRNGFYLYSDISAIPGDWFVIDYTAIKSGSCRVSLIYYDYEHPGPGQDPQDMPDELLIHELAFFNVATRDFDNDHSVGLSDCAYMADCWLWTITGDEDSCAIVDLNSDTYINFTDLAMFADFWLEMTKY